MFLEGEKSDTFSLEQGVAQGCSLSPILHVFCFIHDLLIEVERQGYIGVQLNNGKSIVGMSDSSQKLIDVVHKFCNW